MCLPRLFFVWMILAVFVLAGGACHLVPATQQPPTPSENRTGYCETNADCLDGQYCNIDYRYCRTVGADPGRKVSFQLIPPPSLRLKNPALGKVLKQQFHQIDLGQIQDGDIWARPSYSVSGKVLTRNKALAVPARIRFINLETVSGQPLVQEVESDANSGRYSLQLTYGLYRVEILPKNKLLPPWSQKRLKLDNTRPENSSPDRPAKEKTGYQVHFVLPEEEEYLKISGRIVTQKAPHSPLAGLQVQAVSKEGTLLSTTTTTDSHGEFVLSLQPKADHARLRVVMQTQNDAPRHPEVEVPCPLPPQQGNSLQLGDLKIGQQAKEIVVQGVVRNAQNNSPVEGTSISSLGTVGQGTYKADTQTDANGHFTLTLLAGQYQLIAIPPLQSSLSRVVLADQRLQQSQQIPISLSTQKEFRGKICAGNGEFRCDAPLPQIQIRARWRAPLAALQDPIGSFSLIRTEVTDRDGEFVLLLDPGVYELTFIPPAGSGFARITYPRFQFDQSNSQLKSKIPRARYLIGRIIGPDRFPIINMTIEMYDNQNVLGGSALFLGRATTNSKGEFSIPYYAPTSEDP